jgi:hypothetical protein
LHGVLGRILYLLSRHDIRLQPHHIRGELNVIADRLSRTAHHNRVRFDEACLHQLRRRFHFDLFGSSLRSLAPAYPTSLSFRPRRLAEAPPGALSVAAPPWNQILALLNEAGAAPEEVKGSIFLILPHWPAQPWWPLAVALANGLLWQFRGTPWISPGGKRLPYTAVGLWVGRPP